MAEPVTITTSDGVALEAELALPGGAPRAAFVVCHPHPQFGGTMRSIVVSALFEALPAAGIACLRFNFRGVEGSGGTFDAGDGERADAVAAVAAMTDVVPSDVPLVLAGWSFGADIALSVHEPAISAWLGIAPPLKFARAEEQTGHDPRPKLIALAEHDEFRAPDEVRPVFEAWTNTAVEIVGGASHFFVGRTDRLVTLALGFAERVELDVQR